MARHLLLVLIFTTVLFQFCHSEPGEQRSHGDPQEYCQKETFRPRCWKNEVIVMKSAIYGRMKIGKCINAEDLVLTNRNDPRYLGCSVDVLGIMDAKCSGKLQCDVSIVIDDDLQNISPCYKELFLYLEASYTCAPVIADDRSCFVAVASTLLHISGWNQSLKNCGTKTHPWILQAPTGQRINISLVSFGKSLRETGKQLISSCESYGNIVEKAVKKNISICSEITEREKYLYTTETSAVDIILNKRNESFLIQFQAIGCSDLIPPEDAWLKRNNDEAIVGCYSSRQTWQLKCDGRQWIGVVGNCSISLSAEALQNDEIVHDENFQTLGILAISGVGLAICFLIICIGAICSKRFSEKGDFFKHRENQNPNFQHPTSDRVVPLTSSSGSNNASAAYDVYAGSEASRFNSIHNGGGYIQEGNSVA